MLRHYRNKYRKILACLILAGLATPASAFAQSVTNSNLSGLNTRREVQIPNRDAEQHVSASIQNDIHNIATALAEANKKSTSAAEMDQSKRNLAAQERMAFWVPWMFWLGSAEIIITFIGVILVWRTLIHTRASAIAAREAVQEAKAATDVAKAQINAYVKIDKAEFLLVSSSPGERVAAYPRVQITATNSGNSQAIAFRWNVRTFYSYEGAERFLRGTEVVLPPSFGVAIASQDSVHQKEECTHSVLNERDLAALEAGTISAYFEIEIIYRTIFGVEQKEKSTFHGMIYNSMLSTSAQNLSRFPVPAAELAKSA